VREEVIQASILVRDGSPWLSTKEGRKDDQKKTRYDLLPPELMEGAAQILTFGAEKYGERNWELGMSWGRPFGALMRHMWAWWRGEKCDAETGKSHLWHAACCIGFLIAFEERKIGKDDRPGAGAEPQSAGKGVVTQNTKPKYSGYLSDPHP
jgi:hypothetical protein